MLDAGGFTLKKEPSQTLNAKISELRAGLEALEKKKKIKRDSKPGLCSP